MSKHEGDSNQAEVGSGRFRREPRASSPPVATKAEGDGGAPDRKQVEGMIASLAEARGNGGLTVAELNDYSERNKSLLDDHPDLRKAFFTMPISDMDEGEVGLDEEDAPDEDSDAVRWLASLDDAQYEIVARAAYAQFRERFPSREAEIAEDRPYSRPVC